MARKQKVDFDALGADYRHAKDAVPDHLRKMAAVELERAEWLRKHQGLPPGELWNVETGDPIHPELIALDAAVSKAEADVAWCRCLVIACGEAIKGVRFEDVPDGPRPALSEVLAKIGA